MAYSTMQDRRRKHSSFAVRWDAALVFFAASVSKNEGAGGRHENESRDVRRDALRAHAGGPGAGSRHEDARFTPLSSCSAAPFRTGGGEPVLRRTRNGRLQLQRAAAGRLTPAAEQAFLAAVSATCNLSLAAASVGACFGAFNKRRKSDPAFARELRLAIGRGHEALERALLESTLAASYEHDAWRTNDPPAMPPMNARQALQLMYLHQKAALLVDEPTPMRRRRGESNDARCERLALMSEARDARARDEFEVAEAERMARGEPAWGPAGERVRRALRQALAQVDLSQVTGWSRADAAKTADAEAAALFGGWRIAEMEARRDAEWDAEWDAEGDAEWDGEGDADMEGWRRVGGE